MAIMNRNLERETPLMRQIRDALSRTGRCTLWRNICGVDVTRGVRYGLGVGSADLVGFIHGAARALFIEVKTSTGRISPEQHAWIEFVRSKGAAAYVVRSVPEALAALEDACKLTR